MAKKTEPILKPLTTQPLDDCAISVVVTHPGKGKAKFQLERIPSHGKNYKAIQVQKNGRMKVRFDAEIPLTTLSFILPPEDASGGFAGIKIWRAGKKEPRCFVLPPDGHWEPIDGVFEVEARYSEPDKATILIVRDNGSVKGKFRYMLGVHRKETGFIDQHDPQIYNTGGTGAGGDDGNG